MRDEGDKTPASIALTHETVERGWGESIICPVCGYDYVHLGNIRREADPNGKTTRTCIAFWGECDHTWDLVLVEHKGNAFAYLDNAKEEHPVKMRDAMAARV